MIARSDLRPDDAPECLEIFQLSDGPLPACHVYMEAQICTPDSRYFVYHESAQPHGSDKDDPRHRYLLSDLNGKVTALTNEVGATGPAISPDGRWFYYFVNETELNAGRLMLKRRPLAGGPAELLQVLDHPVEPLGTRISCVYPLSTIRSDGGAIAISGFFGDGSRDDAPWGLLVFDLKSGEVKCVLHGQSWCNLHPQYCRAREGDAVRDILVQENHGNKVTSEGGLVTLVSGPGCDIHVIRDDGGNPRDMPWGRDGNEHAQGHQCWRGRSTWAITSTCTSEPAEQQLIESLPVNRQGHLGSRSKGGVRNELSRSFDGPTIFSHFATDIAGERLVSDLMLPEGPMIVAANLGEPGVDAASAWRYLSRTGANAAKGAHRHPFLTPDGRTAFFNSDESGVLRPYLIRGLPDA